MGKTKRVLIASPDSSVREFFGRLVQTCAKKEFDEKICIFQTECLADAGRIARDNDIELFIIDAAAGERDKAGLEFVASLRKIEKYVFVPVIILSADAQDRYPAFQRLHCFGFLEKPILPVDAAKLMKEALHYRTPETARRYVHFKYGCIVHIMRIDDIIRVEHKRREMYVHTADEVVRIPYRTCSETARQLAGARFAVYARGKLVNLHHVKSVDAIRRRIILKAGGGELSAGREYLKKIRDTLQEM